MDRQTDGHRALTQWDKGCIRATQTSRNLWQTDRQTDGHRALTQWDKGCIRATQTSRYLWQTDRQTDRRTQSTDPVRQRLHQGHVGLAVTLWNNRPWTTQSSQRSWTDLHVQTHATLFYRTKTAKCQILPLAIDATVTFASTINPQNHS